ncbi:uncharacterized protein L969DRAFT_353804 [Mixia osmundae IAM 14324]|uniref:DUF2256 and DUF3253 domain-containing protein n=1 Tax=Mixia osmundae (strain CBS 9802 / IAM 14324 / JCM 22182 / KY 12970) TaxID=764103 RepID=G7E5G3_MIXOS|nr:uncharacterized protein L969DRAFT_353804 [Mixia osmundae IAM 14324]KEI40776.1 hypothetical protein L969DRAFT_353804 [Mixia osmundae IAM 14324]GAA98073.1 hypothetical protein E5Q_04755 [Mixia osmundae IAM 14324]
MEEQKLCRNCGRIISPRAKWADDWATIRYCSKSCKAHKQALNRPDSLERSIELEIMTMLASQAKERKEGRSKETTVTCEQVEARMDEKPDRELVRQAARRLVAQGKIEITQQGGQVVEPSFARGVMHLRLR